MRHPSGSATSLVFGITSLLFCWLPPVGLPAVLGALIAARWATSRTPAEQTNGVALAARVCAGLGFLLGIGVALWWLLLIGLIQGVAMHHPANPPPPPIPVLTW
jgi:hypothetical protein